MSKLRANITYSHRLNSKITSDFTILNTNSILDTNRNNNIVDTNTTEILMEKSNEIVIEEDSDDEIDPINIENKFGEYLQD